MWFNGSMTENQLPAPADDIDAQLASYLLQREEEIESDRLVTRHFEEGF